jgi:hypothetical protein
MKPANMWSPWLQAVSALALGLMDLKEGRADEAIEACTKRPDVGIPALFGSDMFFYYNYPLDKDVLACAYVAKGALDEAIGQ